MERDWCPFDRLSDADSDDQRTGRERRHVDSEEARGVKWHKFVIALGCTWATCGIESGGARPGLPG